MPIGRARNRGARAEAAEGLSSRTPPPLAGQDRRDRQIQACRDDSGAPVVEAGSSSTAVLSLPLHFELSQALPATIFALNWPGNRCVERAAISFPDLCNQVLPDGGWRTDGPVLIQTSFRRSQYWASDP